MKAVTIKQIKDELAHRSNAELQALCLRLSRFKKENKELLTYLLFVSDQEEYIRIVQGEVDDHFDTINTSSYYFMKKSLRKILRLVKKYIRYTQRKETEVELLIFFCTKLKALKPDIFRNKVLTNMYDRQIATIKKTITTLHEDLQYDYGLLLEELD